MAACALISSPLARAQVNEPAAAPRAPPRVALVLASGGARGLAHVGVLRALEEQSVVVDLIVGSEEGALVGGLYAAGFTPDEIERTLLSPGWNAALQDRSPRRSLSFRAKQEDREFLVDLPLGLDGSGLILPPGLFAGSRLRLELARLTVGSLGTRDFDELPIAFRALATDLESGAPVALERGSLALAIEASLSTPVLRAPVRCEGRRLVSGAIAAPLPIETALAAGAGALIVVDLGVAAGERERWSFFDVGARVMDAAGARNAAQALTKLRPGDILVAPAVQDVDLADSRNAVQLVERGHAAAVAQRERLGALGCRREEFAEQLRERRAHGRLQPIVDRVRVAPGCALSEASVKARMETREGQPLDPRKAGDDLAKLYGLRLFQRVDYDLEPTSTGHGELVVHTEPMASAPLHWRMGLTGELSAGDDVNFQIGAGVRWAPTDAWGSEARAQVEVGNRLRLFLEYRQALERAGDWFLVPYASWEDRPVYVETGDGGLTQYSVQEFQTGLDLVRQMGEDWEARAGLVHRSGNSNQETAGAALSSDQGDFEEGGLRFALTCDSLDDTAFPSAGSYMAAEWFLPVDGFAPDQDETVTIRGDHALRWGDDSLVLGAELDTLVGDQGNVQSFFPLGGFLRLSGLHADEISGPTAALARAVYLRPLQERGLENKLFTWYGGLSVELGNVFAEFDDLALKDLRPGGSLFLGVNTLVGPAYLGLGLSEGGERSVFLVFGRAF